MFYYEMINGVSHATFCEKPEFSDNFDLIVAGLGSAGSFLALTAAENGLKVLGIERGTCCGGMGVQGAVNGYYNGYKGGRFEEIDNSTAKYVSKTYRNFFNHPDAKKIRIEQALIKEKVKIEFNSLIVGIYAENQEIIGVKLLVDGEKINVGCKFLSDSTSEGFVLKALGISGSFGRSTDGATVPFSSVRVFKTTDNSLGRTNDDSGYLNPYDDADFTKATITAHGKHLADINPQKERFLFVAPLIGNREGMTITGEQTVTLKDVLYETPWKNTLFCAYSDIDKHGCDRAFDSKEFQDWFVISNLSTITFKIKVPLGAIVPKGWKRLVSVSRCLGVDSYVSSAVRMNRDMYRLGEAAGVAVALAVKENKNTVIDTDYNRLHSLIVKRNCFDPEPNALRGFVTLNSPAPYVAVEWLTDFEEIKKALSSDCPGVAIWSCKLLGAEKVADKLADLLNSDNENLRLNAAITLGFLEDKRSIDTLRETIKNRSAYHFLDCRRSNQMRSVIAICLLGRFCDTKILGELYDILKPEEYGKKMYHTFLAPNYKLSIVENLNSVYYQHFSFTVVTLLQIAKKHTKFREEIHQKLIESVKDGSYLKKMTNAPVGSSFYMIAENIAKYIYDNTK